MSEKDSESEQVTDNDKFGTNQPIEEEDLEIQKFNNLSISANSKSPSQISFNSDQVDDRSQIIQDTLENG